jgi:hypothetical protein
MIIISEGFGCLQYRRGLDAYNFRGNGVFIVSEGTGCFVVSEEIGCL